MSTTTKLLRGLTLTDAVAIVVGAIIGNGVFLKTTTMAQLTGSSLWVILAWIVAGALSLAGALAYAELGALIPEAGGEYVYLREGFGDLSAFLYGWMRFWIASPGTIAASAVASMTFLSAMIDLTPFGGETVCAVLMIIFFSIINCFSVAFGGRVQTLMTALKVVIIVGLIGGIFFLGGENPPGSLGQSFLPGNGFPGWAPFGSAVLAALWAYDGWASLPMVAGEVKNPQRNIPLSLFIGMFCVLAIYGLLNVAYFFTLPLDEILNANSTLYPDALPVATKAAITAFGIGIVGVLSGSFVLSSLGSMNSGILTSARVPYAMAHDGLFFKQLANVNEKSHVPVVSILVQAVVSAALALSGTFDQLTDYVVFALWIFYAMVTMVVFKLRKTRPQIDRPYKTFGYPFVPALFVLVSVLLLINTVISSPKSTAIGLTFILSGIPVFYFFKKSVTRS